MFNFVFKTYNKCMLTIKNHNFCFYSLNLCITLLFLNKLFKFIGMVILDFV